VAASLTDLAGSPQARNSGPASPGRPACSLSRPRGGQRWARVRRKGTGERVSAGLRRVVVPCDNREPAAPRRGRRPPCDVSLIRGCVGLCLVRAPGQAGRRRASAGVPGVREWRTWLERKAKPSSLRNADTYPVLLALRRVLQSARICVLIRLRVRRVVIRRAPTSPSAESAMPPRAPMPASTRLKPPPVAATAWLAATDPGRGPVRAPAQRSSWAIGRYECEHRSASGKRACAGGTTTAPSASATLEAVRESMMVMRDRRSCGCDIPALPAHGLTVPGLCPFVIRRIFTP
jgi:hypothetical protein